MTWGGGHDGGVAWGRWGGVGTGGVAGVTGGVAWGQAGVTGGAPLPASPTPERRNPPDLVPVRGAVSGAAGN